MSWARCGSIFCWPRFRQLTVRLRRLLLDVVLPCFDATVEWWEEETLARAFELECDVETECEAGLEVVRWVVRFTGGLVCAGHTATDNRSVEPAAKSRREKAGQSKLHLKGFRIRSLSITLGMGNVAERPQSKGLVLGCG